MAQRAILTITKPEQRQIIQNSGVQVISDYETSMVVLGEPEQLTSLRSQNVEVDEMAYRPIRTGRVEYTMRAAMAANIRLPIEARPNRRNYYLVQLACPPTPEWLDQLRSAGATVQDSLDHDTLLVGMLPSAEDRLKQLPWVEAVTPYRPAMKFAPRAPEAGQTHQLGVSELAATPVLAGDPDEVQQVEISVFPHESTEELATMVREAGGTVLGQSDQAMIAQVKKSALPRMAEQPGVQAILPHEFPKFSNNRATGVLRIPADRVTFGSDLSGDGVIVGIADSGLDTGAIGTLHKDFAGRVVEVKSLPLVPSLQTLANGPAGFNDGAADTGDGHGTHVAGSVLGDGSAARAAGVAGPLAPSGSAPRASLFFQAVEQQVTWKPGVPLPAEGLFGLPDNIEDLFREAYNAGARIHTNSWGGPARTRTGQNIAGQYSKNGRGVDKFCFEHPDLLILFAAGNDGIDQNGDGIIDLDSIGSPAEAKNCVTVGASENNRPATSLPVPAINVNWNQLNGFSTQAAAGHVSDNPEGIAPFSGRGPADDGRIKPDVVAPGTNILSVMSSKATRPLWGPVKPPTDPLHDLYQWSGGTSMATPLVAGTAALVREFLVKRRGHFKLGEKPSGALMKAILVNGAQRVAGNFAGEVPPPPSPVCGFGRVNLIESLANLVFDDDQTHSVTTGQMRLYDCVAQAIGSPLQITLAWTDAPATVGQGGLTNRLYLQVVTPAGQILNGDTSAFPNAVNNVQRLVVEAATAGTYKVRIRAVSVTVHSPVVASPVHPQQNFAVAANAASLTFIS